MVQEEAQKAGYTDDYKSTEVSHAVEHRLREREELP